MSIIQEGYDRKSYHETSFISATIFVFLIVVAVPKLNAQIQSGNKAYLIKSKTSHKALQVRVVGSSPGQQGGFPGFPVTQNKITKSKGQKFSFALGAGRTYFIKTYDKLFVSVKYRAAVASSNAGATSGISTLKLVQDKRYTAPRNPAVANTSKPDDQRWQLVPVDGDGFTYLIQNVGFPNVVLESSTVSPEVMLATKTGSENQKWIISEPDDLMNEDQASSAELRIFNDIVSNQEGVGLLEENPKPIYYTYKLKPPGTNSTIDMVYKYKKIIDRSKVSASIMEKGRNWANEKLKGHENVEKVVTYSTKILQDFLDLGGDIASFFIGSSTKVAIDCWVPMNKYRQIMCGKMKENAEFCPQDYSHTEATVDKDVNLDVIPNEKFKYMLNGNKYLEDKYTMIEGEVNIKHSLVKDPDFPSRKKIIPANPLLLTLQKDDNVCLSGPWMADILEFDFGKYDVTPYENNEIHPINQAWFKKRGELNLVAIADGTPYFHKKDQRQFEASGLNQQSRFYVAFEIPLDVLNGEISYPEYHINGTGYAFKYPGGTINSTTLTFKYRGKVCMKIIDNGLLNRHKTHSPISLKHVRIRPDGSIQGYIFIETEKIIYPGGTINIFVKKL